MSLLSKINVAASIADFEVKRLFRTLVGTDKIIALGSTIADATQLTARKNVVTAADDAVGVKLPHALTDMDVEIVNTVANKTLLVYPFSATEQINSITAGSAFSLVGGARGQFYCDADGHWYVAAANLTGTATSASTAQLDYTIVTPGTSSPSKALVLDATESLAWATTDSTASETATLIMTDTRTGAGATGWAAKFDLVSNVALGSYANALYGIIELGASGKITGLGAGVCGEIVLSAGCTDGTYACFEAEMGMPSGAKTGTAASFMYLSLYGADAGTFDTDGYLMQVAGVTKNSGKVYADATTGSTARPVEVLRVLIDGNIRYLPLYSTVAIAA